MNNRVLIVDDSQAIHDDFQKILPVRHETDELQDLLARVLDDGNSGGSAGDGAAAGGGERAAFAADHAYQGTEAVEKVRSARQAGKPYALIYTDVRMPPGINGVETARRMWELDADLEIVVVTAYSDHSWREILEQLGSTDQLQFVRKPFDATTIKQMTLALTRKWALQQQVRRQVETLESAVAERTAELRKKVADLEAAAGEIRQLRGILPMCVYCHKIRGDSEYWQRVDEYIRRHSVAEVSHGICPECYAKHVQPELDMLDNKEETDAHE